MTKEIIKAKKGIIPLELGEIWKYRNLLYFLIKRDIKVRYSQTILGGLWAIIQPVFMMLTFTIFFGKMAKMPSDGVPYPIFVYAGLLPWIYFANALSASGNSLVGSANLITKVYFPRLIIPISNALSGLVDFCVAMLVMAGLMIYYNIFPDSAILLLPVLVIMTFFCALGFGLWLSALNVKYRDIKYVIPFLIQIWLFCTPVIYPSTLIKGRFHILMVLNPMSGIIDAFRASLLTHHIIPWRELEGSALIILVMFLSGFYYFKQTERHFADVI